MIAGAGSGKTTSLVKGLDHIRNEFGATLNTNRQRVACITYTEVATAEIFDDVGQDHLFHVSTIHSFAWELIKPFTREIRALLESDLNSKIDALSEHNNKPRTRQNTIEKNLAKIDRYQEGLAHIVDVKKFSYQANSNIPKGILGHAEVIKLAPQLILENKLLRTILSRKYPFFFVDESQDTVEPFVRALISVRQENQDFCLGFFGDQMQNIYMTGIGEIPTDFGATAIEKPENFRSPKNVLNSINSIREKGDGLQQESGREFPFEGTSTFFVLPQDANRTENLVKIQDWLASQTGDEKWRSSDDGYDVKQLVIVHRMAANRLGFSNLYSALNDNSTTSITAGFTEGDHWTIRPFLSVILPLVEASEINDRYTIVSVLRKSSPKLNGLEPKENLGTDDLKSLKDSVDDVVRMFRAGDSIRDVLKFSHDRHLIDLDKRLLQYVDPSLADQLLADVMGELAELMANVEADQISKQETVLLAYLDCPANEFSPYKRYIEKNTAYATQHGIKGAEFDRVLVILDDDEGKSQRQYSYEKFLGLKALSDTDEKNVEEGKDSALSRTLRLFYVSCSRATKDLAIVLFTQDLELARQKILESEIVEPGRIIALEDLT